MTELAAEPSWLPRLPMTKALKVLFDEALGEEYAFAVGGAPREPIEGVVPVTLRTVPAPYGILYPLWTNTDGPWHHPDADQVWNYQVSMFGLRWDQNEWMRDRVLKTLLARDEHGVFRTPLEVDGMKVMQRELTDDVGYSPDNAVPSGIIQSDLRFSLRVTPIRA